MAGCVPHIVEIVMLAPRAHALLGGYRARVRQRLHPCEDVLELHHAGVGEHQRGIVARHKRARRHMLVAVLPKKIDEGPADIVEGAHN